MSRRRINRSMFLALGTMAAIYLGAVVEVAAQGYPSKTVRIVVPSSPGGGSDLVARTLAAPLAEMLGQPFIVENRVGSGGIVGTQQVAQSAPDGHTLLVTFDTFAINPFLFKNLQWDPIRDFTPIMQVCRYPQVLLVHPSLGVKSVKQFVALAKQKGAELNFGSAGPASSSRLVYELFKEVAGLDTVPVHYKGGGPVMQALISGQVQVMFFQASGTIQQHAKAGRLNILAISTATRSPTQPELPTIAETYPGWETQAWAAMLAPAGTPRPVIDRLHSALAKILADPGMKERFEKQGAEIIAGAPEALTRLLREDQSKWSKLIRDKNIVAE